MTTIKNRSEAGQLKTRDAQQLFRIWCELPTGRLTREQLDKSILASAPGVYELDYARANIFREELLSGGAVNAFRSEGDSFTYYQKSVAFRVPEDNRHGSAAFNKKLEELAAKEEEEFRQQDEAAQRHLEKSDVGRQKREVEGLVDRRINATEARLAANVTERMEARLEEITSELTESVVEAITETLDKPARARLFEALRKRGVAVAA